jgi:hypothetical protein
MIRKTKPVRLVRSVNATGSGSSSEDLADSHAVTRDIAAPSGSTLVSSKKVVQCSCAEWSERQSRCGT